LASGFPSIVAGESMEARLFLHRGAEAARRIPAGRRHGRVCRLDLGRPSLRMSVPARGAVGGAQPVAGPWLRKRDFQGKEKGK